MNLQARRQWVDRQCATAAALVALVLAPLSVRGESDAHSAPSSARIASVQAVGAVQTMSAAAPSQCGLKQAQLERSRHAVDDAYAATAAARLRLVREHLRVTQNPMALLDAVLAEEEFQAERAELKASRRELSESEARVSVRACDTTGDRSTASTRQLREVQPITFVVRFPRLTHAVR